MKNVLRLAIVDPNDDSREALKTLLLGMDMIWLEAECSRYEFFADVVSQTQPEIGIITLDADSDKALKLVEKVNATTPGCSILVLSSSTDGSLILRAMRAGAKEFISLPINIEDLVAALGRISDRHYGQGESRTRGSTVISVAGATGGVGCTSLAVNLGCSLAQDTTNTVALIDLDMSLGDADVFLDTIPDYTLVDVAQNVSRLDFTLLKRSLIKHDSGLFLLPRPMQMEDAATIGPDDFLRVVGLLKATFTHVVFDLSKSYSPLDMVAMESSDHILLMTQLDLPCLRNIVRLMSSFSEMEGVADKIKIIVNRAGLESGEISVKKAQDTIGREVFWQLPNDYRTMVDVRNNGVPLIEQAPKAKITQSILQLADQLSGKEPRADTSGGKSTLGRLMGLWSGRSEEPQAK